MSHTIEFSQTADEAMRTAIARPLIAYNLQQTGIADYRPVVGLVRDATGEVVGGLWGRTMYGWLYVELLVVPESLRRSGLGTELMNRAEAEAIARGLPRSVARHLLVPGARILRETWLSLLWRAHGLSARIVQVLHDEGAVARRRSAHRRCGGPGDRCASAATAAGVRCRHDQ